MRGYLWLGAFLLSGVNASVAADYLIVEPPGSAVIVEEPRQDPLGPLWLGRFSGGNNASPGADPIALQWVDEKAYFTSEKDCALWIRDMRRAYRDYAGYKTCVFIR